MTPDQYLTQEWRALRNDASPRQLAHVAKAIDVLHAIDAIDDPTRELWSRRITTCPGHDDEGGRSWCAYGCALREERP